MTRTATVMVAGLILATLAASALADGMLVPVREDLRVRGSWAVRYHHVDMLVRDQVASVTIDQEFYNTGSSAIEVEYMFPVPPGAAIDAMTMVVGGQELTGKLMPADEARRIYENIVRAKKDPALLEYVGYGLYRTRAFPLEPNKPAKVIIHYTQVCRQDQGVVEIHYPLNTEKFSAKAIEDVTVTVDIKAKADITAIYSPSHELKTERKDPRHVTASYQVKGQIPNTDFVVMYKAKNEEVGATLLSYQPDESKDGYFLLLASPNPKSSLKAVQPKDVVIVIDRSGSMSSDKKLTQAKDAMRYILNNLNAEDRFNVVVYSDGVESFFERLVAPSREYLTKALDGLDQLTPMGGTNIGEALQQAMKQLQSVADLGRGDGPVASPRPAYVIFLTDGLPTIGTTDEARILAEVAKANSGRARVFSLGVGYDVNVRLLDRLAGENGGVTDYAKPGEALEARISSMYAKIKNPVMTNLKIAIQGVQIRDYYPRAVGDLFDGAQLLVAGRYDRGDAAKLREGRATLVVTGVYLGKEQGFEYPVTLRSPGRSPLDSYVERLWATRRVGFLLDEIQLHGSNRELVDEVIRLSRDYGIMTPYTSFLAEENVHLASARDTRVRYDQARPAEQPRSGAAAEGDSVMRLELKEAQRAPAPSTTPAMPAGDSSGGAAGGPDSGQGQANAPGDGSGNGRIVGTTTVYGYKSGEDYDKGRRSVVTGLRVIGDKTLYRRGDLWIMPEAAGVDLVKDADKIKTVERFTEAYFALLKLTSITENQILSQQGDAEQILMKCGDQIYLVK